MKEMWRSIPDYFMYKVSTWGRVKSFHSGSWRFLSQARSAIYPTVNLVHQDRKNKTFRVHSLVMSAFVGPCPKGKICRHLDGNPNNNRLDNLKYGTYKQNEQDKKAVGTYYTRITSNKLTKNDVMEIRYLYNEGFPQVVLADYYGVSCPTITRVINKTTWRHIK